MEININEALRYLKMSEASQEMKAQIVVVAEEIQKRFQPKFLYRVFTLNHKNNEILLDELNVVLKGKTAEKMLNECRSAAVLVCTLGFEFENYLRTLQAKNMSEAVIADACGSAWVEAGCDKAQTEIKNLFPQCYITDRFSPGYGDFSLDYQRELVKAVDGEKKMGVYLTETMLFNPSKTVSAVIGISDKEQGAKIRGCKFCGLKENCEYRKAGLRCDN